MFYLDPNVMSFLEDIPALPLWWILPRATHSNSVSAQLIPTLLCLRVHRYQLQAWVSNPFLFYRIYYQMKKKKFSFKIHYLLKYTVVEEVVISFT